jgi:hypothetical protein
MDRAFPTDTADALVLNASCAGAIIATTVVWQLGVVVMLPVALLPAWLVRP